MKYFFLDSITDTLKKKVYKYDAFDDINKDDEPLSSTKITHSFQGWQCPYNSEELYI